MIFLIPVHSGHPDVSLWVYIVVFRRWGTVTLLLKKSAWLGCVLPCGISNQKSVNIQPFCTIKTRTWYSNSNFTIIPSQQDDQVNRLWKIQGYATFYLLGKIKFLMWLTGKLEQKIILYFQYKYVNCRMIAWKHSEPREPNIGNRSTIGAKVRVSIGFSVIWRRFMVVCKKKRLSVKFEHTWERKVKYWNFTKNSPNAF